MKIATSILALWSLCGCLFLAVVVTATDDEYYPIYTFNNGMVQVGKSCNDAEWTRLKDAMGSVLSSNSTLGQRQLRSSHNTKNHRTLNRRSTCNSCGHSLLCLMFNGNGNCAKLAGAGRRQLTALSPCSHQVTRVDAAFANVRSTVSTTCQALLDAPRNVTCALFTKDCDITHFSMYRTGTSHYRPPLIAKFNATGTTRFCSSVGEVTFWAETNFALGQVKFEMLRHSTTMSTSLTTIKRHSEWSRPYRLPMGKMAPGLYTIRAHSENDPLQNKTATFVVDNC